MHFCSMFPCFQSVFRDICSLEPTGSLSPRGQSEVPGGQGSCRLGHWWGRAVVRTWGFSSLCCLELWPLPTQTWDLGRDLLFSFDSNLLIISQCWIVFGSQHQGHWCPSVKQLQLCLIRRAIIYCCSNLSVAQATNILNSNSGYFS